MRKLIPAVLLPLFIVACSSNEAQPSGSAESAETMPTWDKVDGVAVDMNDKGIGPVTSVTLSPEIDDALAKRGEEIYNINCTACHRPDKKLVGPPHNGIMDIRAPEWIMNMILNPEEMTEKDPIAKQLLLEYNGSPMSNQGLSEDDARAILEYFRTLKKED